MTHWHVAPYEPGDEPEWERVVAASGNGTFLHTRRFLAYHGDRFADRSLVVRDARGRLAGVFPAALRPDDPAEVVSHPGATFGGLLAEPGVTGGDYRSMMVQALALWRARGARRLTYKLVPSIYHAVPRQEDGYVLGALGARVSRRTLSACIDLAHRLPPSSRRKRSLQKAQRSGCALVAGEAVLADLWPVAESVLMERHGVRPVHSLAEIQDLSARFPSNVECVGAYAGGRLVAGVVLFVSPTVTHVQYSVSSPAGTSAGAMDLLIEHAAARAAELGTAFLDLGISTDHAGHELNEGLHRFKMEFGAGTVVYETCELDLTASSASDSAAHT